MSDLPDLEISKLPSLDAVNKDTDYLVVSKESTAYASGYGSFKVTPNQLMQAVSTTNLSDLGDVNISSPENEQVLRYDSSTNKWINSEDSGGTEVEANPAETATDTLTSIKVADTVYSVGGGGGGTNVVANPTGTATDTLNKLQVDETIYNIAGGSSSADHITLTQAEYDALVEAGTVDPDAFYFIKDTNGDGQDFQPVIYSLEEREIGVWTDGKPLYERTITITAPSSGETIVNHNISNADYIYVKEGTLTKTNNSSTPCETYHSSSSWSCGVYNVNRTSFTLFVGDNLRQYVTGGFITFRYTKTTDTAGSGQWTPQGVPAVHYSTDEQVVGTWIDGSTVYEKVITFSPQLEISYSAWTSTGLDVSNLNIDKIISASCMSVNAYQGDILAYVDNGILKLVTPRNGDAAFVSVLILRYTKSTS